MQLARMAVPTAEAIFDAHEAFAPSHTMPATMESAFTTAWHASL